ncbi:MAG: glycoside hydrolase domain-containing protein [Candidatus Omnitrophota bacterium]
MECRSVDPLIKIYKNFIIPSDSYIADAVRGEVASIQAVFKPGKNTPLGIAGPVKLTCGSSHLEGEAGFVGFVPVRQNTPDTLKAELEKEAPALFPDPILEDDHIDCRAGEAAPVWINIPIPRDQEPGIYRGAVKIFSDAGCASCDITLIVHNARLPEKQSLNVTNWFMPDKLAEHYGEDMWTEAQWERIEYVAHDLAAHRQNVVLTHMFDLVEFYRDGSSVKPDFRRFDRFVETFERYGVARSIEGTHLGNREGGIWEAENFVLNPVKIKNPDGSHAHIMENVRAGSDQCREFLGAYLPALRGHLSKKGWLGRYMQHIADEPTPASLDSWKTLSQYVKEFAPGVRRMDATMTSRLKGSMEVWVPLLHQYDAEKEFYASRQKEGDEVWFYTCLIPRGAYPNRFIDFSLLKTRILHWINFRYGLTGYLHWGYNWWSKDPFSDVEPRQGDICLPPGDNAIVYPGKKGIVRSIRWEMMRKGIEDHEMLVELGRYRPDLAAELCREAVPDIKNHMRQNSSFNSLRLRLIKSLSQAQSSSTRTA